jgi:hypothetical protein
MGNAKTLLILGTSNLTYAEASPSDSLLSMVEERLAASGSQAWQIVLEPLQPGRSMAERAAECTRRHEPDAVLLHLAAAPFAFEFVTNRVRRRWPRAYSGALRLSQTLKTLAGGLETNKRRSPRRLVYLGPEWLALRLIGGEVSIPVEHAIENTRAALEALARFEDIDVLCRLPVGQQPAPRARTQRMEARLRLYNSAVAATCRLHNIAVVDVLARFTEAGRRITYARDGIHCDLRMREYEAGILASEIERLVNNGGPAAALLSPSSEVEAHRS